MTTPYKVVPGTKTKACTWTNRTLKDVSFIRQKPEGFVVCPHCLQDTAVTATGITTVLERHNAAARNKWIRTALTCNRCHGPFTIQPSSEEPGMLCSKPRNPEETLAEADSVSPDDKA